MLNINFDYCPKDSIIYLRRLKIEDVTSEYVDWLNDPNINKFLECRHAVHTIDTVKEYIEDLSCDESKELIFGIFLRETDNHIGNIKLGPINNKHQHAAIGLLIGNSEFWGKGIGCRSIRLISEEVSPRLGLNTLYAGCYSDNIGSYKAFLKAGWISSGKIPSFWMNDDGSRNDELLLTKAVAYNLPLPATGGVTLIGSGKLMLAVASYLRKERVKVQVVFARRHFDDKAFQYLKSIGAKVVKCHDYPDLSTDLVDSIPDYNLLCLCFGPAWIFSDSFISLFSSRIFNYNGIPLPSYLGGAHFTWQILNKSWSGGCYIQQITSDIDRGPIIHGKRYSVPASDDITPQAFEDANFEHGLLFLQQFFSQAFEQKVINLSVETINWNELLYFPRLYTPTHGWINWSWAGCDIFKFCQAFARPYPGARTYLHGEEVSFLKVSFTSNINIHPFCSGLVAKFDALTGFTEILVSGGILHVGLIQSVTSNAMIKPRLGVRFTTPFSKLEQSFMPVSYNQEGVVKS